MAVRGSNDFFLQFGSNAPEFTQQLTEGLGGGIEQINALKAALIEYEKVADRLRGQGSPVGLNFEGLNQAATRIEEATTGFARQFGSQLNSLTSKITGLAEVLATAARMPHVPQPTSGHPVAPGRTTSAPVAAQPLPVPPRPVAPSEPEMPAILSAPGRPVQPKTGASERIYEKYERDLDAWFAAQEKLHGAQAGAAAEADEAFTVLMNGYTKAFQEFKALDKAWKTKAEKIEAHNAQLAQLVAQESATPGPVTPPAAATQSGKPAQPSAVSQVTEAEQKAAQRAVAAAKVSGEADAALAKQNEALAAGARQLVETLEHLNAQLQAGGKSATAGKVEDATTQIDNNVQVANTSSNPVPVMVVGAEQAQAHPHGKNETTKATSATQQQAAKEKVEQVAATTAPNAKTKAEREVEAYRQVYEDAVSRAASHYENMEDFNPYNHDEVVEAERNLKEARARAVTTTAGSNSEPRPKKPIDLVGGTNSSRDITRDADVKRVFDALGQETRAAVLAAREALKNPSLSQAARHEAVVDAGARYLQDPAAVGLKSARLRSVNLAGMLGLNADEASVRGFMTRLLNDSGPARNRARAGQLGGGSSGGSGSDPDAERMARVREIFATSSGQVSEALLAQERALARVNQLLREDASDVDKLSRALSELSRANRGVAGAVQSEERATAPQNRYQQFTGRPAGSRTFGQDVQRHIGYALENTIGYTLVFTGFEKLREIVHTGLEAQAAMTRLQASLDANGRSADGLRTKFEAISSGSAQSLEHVIEAASELSGIFKSNAELTFATNISAQLANISQGTLTAKEAAIGLRDVTAAYGLSGTESIQKVGDQMAHLSQITGVSVKDIFEGTSQIAQEAHEFGLSQRQAAVLSAYISQGTGEPGEESAAQASRTLATLYSGRTQTMLVRNGVATQEQFQQGKTGEVLTNLIEKWDTLNASQRNSIANLMGTGIQARAFAALMNGGAKAVEELNNAQSDNGALSKQNAAYLSTIAGKIKQLKEDFENLGSVLQRLGAFDALGVLAQLMDGLLRSFNATFGRIADFFNSNPITAGLSHTTIVLLEAVAAWKLLGGTVTRALGAMGGARLLGAAGGAGVGGALGGGAGPAGAGARGALGGAAASFFAFGQRPFANAGARAAAIGSGIVGLPGRVGSALSNRFGTAPLTSRDLGSFGLGGAAAATATRAETTSALRLTQAQIQQVLATENATRALLGLAPVTVETSAMLANLARTSGAASVGQGAGAAGGLLSRVGTGRLLGGLAIGAAVYAGYKTVVQPATEKIDGANRKNEDLVTGFLASSDESNTNARKAAEKEGSPSVAAGNPYGNLGTDIAYNLNPMHLLKLPSQIRGAADQGTSDKAFSNEMKVIRGAFKHNIGPEALGDSNDPDKIQAAMESYDKELVTKGAKLVEWSKKHGKKTQAAMIAADLEQAKSQIDDALASRIAAVQKLGDVLNTQQVTQLMSVIQQISQFNPDTLKTQGPAIEALLEQTGAPKGSDAYKRLENMRSERGQGSNTYRLGQQMKFYDDIIKSSRLNIARATSPGGAGVNSDQYKAAITDLNNAMAGFQQTKQQMLAEPVQFATTAASMKADLGDTRGAIADLQRANAGLTAINRTLSADDPQFIANLQQIQQNKLQMAHLETLPAIQGLQQQAAGTADPVAQASIQYEIATKQLAADTKVLADRIAQDRRAVSHARAALLAYEQAMSRWLASTASDAFGGQHAANLERLQATAQATLDKAMDQLTHDSTTETPAQSQDKAAQAAAALQGKQANEAVNAAQAQANMAGIRNTKAVAQAQLAEALRQEAVYGSGALKDQARYYQAVAQARQAEIAIADAVEGQRQAAYSARSAFATRHGDTIKAAATDLAKANQAYAYAVDQYGRNSEQARSAVAQVYQAEQTLISARLEKQNAAIDLQIAQLNARGRMGDDVSAARDEVRKAQNAIRSYIKNGGKRGTAEYDRLQGELVTARRAAFDTALQAQLDTLDFQRETYKITSAQEVRSLQQILKNKQLTLKEQRDITLKIKDLQQSIREQLTQGGLNIPSDIKLPTAYEVRRSLGAGFGGTGTTTNTVNNNQQVTITNNVPNATVANAIANQVIQAINQQTGQHLRANSSTPRLVSTR